MSNEGKDPYTRFLDAFHEYEGLRKKYSARVLDNMLHDEYAEISIELEESVMSFMDAFLERMDCYPRLDEARPLIDEAIRDGLFKERIMEALIEKLDLREAEDLVCDAYEAAKAAYQPVFMQNVEDRDGKPYSKDLDAVWNGSEWIDSHGDPVEGPKYVE